MWKTSLINKEDVGSKKQLLKSTSGGIHKKVGHLRMMEFGMRVVESKAKSTSRIAQGIERSEQIQLEQVLYIE